jgi:hypothetical protein
MNPLDTQRTQLIAALEARGWHWDDGAIVGPAGAVSLVRERVTSDDLPALREMAVRRSEQAKRHFIDPPMFEEDRPRIEEIKAAHAASHADYESLAQACASLLHG